MGQALTAGEALDVIALVGSFRRLLLLVVLERAGHPEERVDAEEAEDADQEKGHRPESEIEDGILRLVVVRGMGEVAREPAVGVGVAFLAGLDHALESDLRLGIVHVLDVMGPMAIRASGGLQIAQGVGLAVDRLGVGFRQVLVARAALQGDLGHELVLLDVLDPVGGMAVLAGRQLLVGLGGRDAVDAGRVILIDPLVAGGARGRDVLGGDG